MKIIIKSMYNVCDVSRNFKNMWRGNNICIQDTALALYIQAF